MNAKTKTQKHVGSCPKSCKEVHEMCNLKLCGKFGKHFASDHNFKFAESEGS